MLTTDAFGIERHHVPDSELAPVAVTYLTREREWVLLEEYRVHECAKECELVIPAGFRFDLASIPRRVWSIVAPFELSIVAPLAHDWLYRNGGRSPVIGPSGAQREEVYTRTEADRIFADLMKREGVSALRREAAYYAVRTFGGAAWRG